MYNCISAKFRFLKREMNFSFIIIFIIDVFSKCSVGREPNSFYPVPPSPSISYNNLNSDSFLFCVCLSVSVCLCLFTTCFSLCISYEKVA